MTRDELEGVIRSALLIEMPDRPTEMLERLTMVLTVRIVTRENQLAERFEDIEAWREQEAERTRLLRALEVERRRPVPEPAEQPKDSATAQASRAAWLRTLGQEVER